MARHGINGVLRELFAGAAVLALAATCLRAQPAPPQAGLLTPAETDWLRQHPNIRLAPTPDYQPVEFFDATAQYAGITAEYFRIIERRLGYHFTIVRLTSDQWLQLDPVARGADVIPVSAATPMREQFWSYTKPFLELPTYVITRNEAEDDLTLDKLAGHRVAVVNGWAAEEFLRTTHTNLIIVPVADPRTGLQQVSLGEADAFVSELPVATAWMEREHFFNLKASAEAGYTYRLGISVRKDWPELRAILDKALASISPVERKQILEHWVKLKTPAERRLENIRRRLWWSAAGLTVLLLSVLLWNRTLAWRVRVRTNEVRLSEEKFSKAFRASPDGLAISELETGRYIEINEGYCRLFGFTRSEMLGHTSLELNIWQNPPDRDKLVDGLKKRGEVRNLEMHMRSRSGEPRIISLSADAIEISGKHCLVSVLHDITDRVRAETEREQAIQREQEARIEYTLRLIAAQEAERKRIAAELHDSMGQNLLLIKNLAQLALKSNTRESAYEQLASISHLATQCIAEARQISRDLHPYQLDHLGLKRSLEAMLENASQASSIRFTWKFEPVDDLFRGDAATNLYRIVQESLNNILKHSGANRAEIRLERDLREVQLRVEDNGAGFDAGGPAGKKGLGLKNITERVRMLGGRWNVDSGSGRGTRVTVTIPIAEQTD